MPANYGMKRSIVAGIKRYVVTGFVLMASCSIAAQTQTPVMVDIAPCIALTDNAERYACYDRLAASVRVEDSASQRVAAEPPQRAPASTPVPAPVAEPQPVPAATASIPVAEFGRDVPTKTETAQVLANDSGENELHDVITDLVQREPNRWLITLQSGQVWYQSNSERFRLVKGMPVRIYPSPLRGSYRLARDDGKESGFIQVQRID